MNLISVATIRAPIIFSHPLTAPTVRRCYRPRPYIITDPYNSHPALPPRYPCATPALHLRYTRATPALPPRLPVRVPGSRPLFPQWSHHVYPQFLPGGHPAHRHSHCKLDCGQHVNNNAHAHARIANYHRAHAGKRGLATFAS